MENNIEELEKKLATVKDGCRLCRAKICALCPNSSIKKRLKKAIKEIRNIEN